MNPEQFGVVQIGWVGNWSQYVGGSANTLRYRSVEVQL
ncbi:hypothetical protein MGAST_22165 [Mycobacterium gastri 'Wayne']|nr:hypothetical protein MGAST_22165 [Mycobacterium gastri 'Wayne']